MMMMITNLHCFKMGKIGIIALLCISLVSCKMFSSSDNFSKGEVNSVFWTNSGGVTPNSETIYLSKDSCSLLVKKLGYKNVLTFQLTTKQLNELDSVLNVNQFDKIKTITEKVYDRGGTKIIVNKGNEKIEVSNASMSFVQKGFIANYKAIENKILDLTYTEINKQKVTVAIKLDGSITKLKGDVLVFVNGKEYYNEKNDGEFLEFDLDLFNSHNEFTVYVMQFGSTFNTVEKKIKTELKVLPESKSITLSIKDDQLIIE